MSNDGSLRGVSVLVAGAGLAGLAAARDLLTRGAEVTVVDARDRVGGRVWTARDGFVERQHGELGGDMIEEAQEEIRALAGELGLKLNLEHEAKENAQISTRPRSREIAAAIRPAPRRKVGVGMPGHRGHDAVLQAVLKARSLSGYRGPDL